MKTFLPGQKLMQTIMYSLLLLIIGLPDLSAQDDLRNCFSPNCSAGDVVPIVYLTDLDGNTLDPTCTEPEPMDALVMFEVDLGRATIYDVALYADLTIDGITQPTIIELVAGVLPQGTLLKVPIATIDWTCGQKVELSNILILWLQGSNNATGELHPCDNNPYNPAQNFCQIDPIIVTAPLSCHIEVDQHVSCFGGSDGIATVEPNGGTESYTYSWENESGTEIATTATATGLSAGTYYVTVNDGITTTQCQATITQPAVALSVTAVSTDATCPDNNNGTTTATASGGTPPYSYVWYNNNDSPIGQTNAIATDLVPGDYYVVITDANDCTATSDAVTVGEEICCTETITAQVDNNSVCVGGSFTLSTVEGQISGAIYTWTGPNAATYAGETVTINNATVSEHNGTFNLSVSYDNGNCTATSSVDVTVNPLPTPASV